MMSSSHYESILYYIGLSTDYNIMNYTSVMN